MNIKSSGFTIIELIFVIVILGILSSVAITKLYVTRDDAKQSFLMQSVNDIGREIISYVLSQGEIPKKIEEVSQISKMLKEEGYLKVKEPENSSYSDILCIKADKKNQNCCLVYYIGKNYFLKLEKGNDTSEECILLQSRVNFQKYPVNLKKRTVKY